VGKPTAIFYIIVIKGYLQRRERVSSGTIKGNKENKDYNRTETKFGTAATL
jgi:hypothetical protein